MTIEDVRSGWTLPVRYSPEDIVADTAELLAGLTREPWGQTSASIYETGRLVALAPWLAGHAERLAYLVRHQRPDGGWGTSDGYDLVPTLSATEALFATLSGGHDSGRPPAEASVPPTGDPGWLADVANRGLAALFAQLSTYSTDILVDTPAVDLIVPAMVESLNQYLEQLRDAPLPGLDRWSGDRRLVLPRGMDRSRLDAVRQRLSRGATVPEKLLHALEIAGTAARDATGVQPISPGTIGGSPAATAAWLGESRPGHPAQRYLEAVARQQGGPVPCATPITVFERSWVLSGLARAGIPFTAPSGLPESLAASLGPAGTPAGPGLPVDADTTSVTLYALALLGKPIDPQSLWAYDTGSHFCTWPGEDGFSISTNAHVLDTFGHYLRLSGGAVSRYRDVVRRLSAWLCDQQQVDGAWQDRWHASPYYATAGCVLALDRYGSGPAVSGAVLRAADWVLETQRVDGSWGRWAGTVEETAYALQVLLTVQGPIRSSTGSAVRRGYAYLQAHVNQELSPPLWHDKDLYLPAAIVRSAALASLWLAQQRPELLKPGIP